MRSSNPTAESRWTQLTGLTADIADVDFDEQGNWTVSCNLGLIGPGTVGWIARQGEGGNPPLAGFIVCTTAPQEEVDDQGYSTGEWSVEGRLHGGLWILGDDIANAGWPDKRAPWGANARRQFRNGEEITPNQLRALLGVMHDSTLRTVELEHLDLTGRRPWWV